MTLKDYLAETQETIEQFADRTGESAHTIAKLFRGERFPRAALAERIIVATNGMVTANDCLDAVRERSRTPAQSDTTERQAA